MVGKNGRSSSLKGEGFAPLMAMMGKGAARPGKPHSSGADFRGDRSSEGRMVCEGDTSSMFSGAEVSVGTSVMGAIVDGRRVDEGYKSGASELGSDGRRYSTSLGACPWGSAIRT